MRFQHSIIKDDIVNEFWDCIFLFKENSGVMDIIFKNERGKDITLRLTNKMTLYFDRWHEDYSFDNDEYERMLWDIRDIVTSKACAVSVTVGDHVYISYLTRIAPDNAEEFMNEDPAEYAGFKRTGAVVECTYYDRVKNKSFNIEKDS